MEHNKRERVGIYVAAFIVLAYTAVGFVHVSIVIVNGPGVVFPNDWLASMLSLASAAMGYLIGKQTSGTPVPVTTQGGEPLQVQPVEASPQGQRPAPAPVATSPLTTPPRPKQ